MRLHPIALAVVLVIAGCGGDRALRGPEHTSTVAARVHPTAEECETDWGGPWTECPQADWIRLVAENAGYRIVDRTGSALVAEGGGQSFYIWSSDASSIVGDEWRTTGRVGGVSVYGDGTVWRWWISDSVDLVVWLSAGPYTDARLPNLDELTPLVRSSGTIAVTW